MKQSAPVSTSQLDVPALALVLLHARSVLQAPVGLDVPPPADPPSAAGADADQSALADWDDLWTQALAFRVTENGARVPQWFTIDHPGIDRVDAARWAQAQRDRLVQGVIGDADGRTRARAEEARVAGFDRVVVLPLVAAYTRRVDATLAVSALTFLDDEAWARSITGD
jgi:hypothetical protein